MVRLSCVGVIWVCCCLMFIVAEGQQTTHPNEVTALKAIKKSFIDRNKNLRNWNRGDPCSTNWNGVLCFNMTLQDGHLHVRELRLLNLNLSGSLSPELGKLSYLQILDVMWNEISGSLPREIGSIVSLELLLVNGNKLTGPLPEEIGYLLNLDRIQIDQNQISGEIPKSFANLKSTKHFHMNNNSLSGPIPTELSRLENLVHLLLDNNNLSGYLPPELAQLPNLRILQLDNNHFDGSTIPPSYGNMSHLLKLSLRNCSLQGPIPDLSKIPDLAYLDLSSNQLDGPIPTATLSEDMTTIDLSNNQLTGGIPANFSGLPRLQRLSLSNNLLSGSVPFTIWQNRTFNETERRILDFQNNRFSDISGIPNVPQNVTLSLQGNPLCSNSNLIQFCGSRSAIVISRLEYSTNSNDSCPPQSCPPHYELAPASIVVSCYCAAPLLVGYRLKSPGFDDFNPYVDLFYKYLSSRLNINRYQLDLDSFKWQKGPRLSMNLKIFPVYEDNKTLTFDRSELLRIMSMFAGWTIRESNTFGPYELINFTLLHPYIDVIPSTTSPSSLSKGAIAGIVVGALAGAVALSAVVSLIILRLCAWKFRGTSKRRKSSRVSIKAGVKNFTYEEMKRATNNFDTSSQVGQGGYGKVYHGMLADGTEVAIKRAKEGSLQGEKEFLTEIELLSRLHHRNLVSLLGYCDEDGEQMLVYEFMPNGTLRDHLSAKTKEPLSFARRLKLALASAKGILYLHTDADPPIFHRDIKASNILLDSQFTAKVADFGLSILAPVPDIEGILPGHVSTIVKGTPGYLDPEYFQTFKLTDKSDVYSLGVVFLEILTGMQPITQGKNIVRVVNVAYQSGMVFSVIDARMGSYPSDCVERFVALALKCCQNETDDRPSMAEVVRELENIWHLMPNSDTKMASDALNSYPSQTLSQETSPSTSKNPYISSDVPGSEIVSGDISNIAPR